MREDKKSISAKEALHPNVWKDVSFFSVLFLSREHNRSSRSTYRERGGLLPGNHGLVPRNGRGELCDDKKKKKQVLFLSYPCCAGGGRADSVG